LKKVQGKKKRDAEEANRKREAEQKERNEGPSIQYGEGSTADTDLLKTKDEDVIF
jgi:hypothetical protein